MKDTQEIKGLRKQGEMRDQEEMRDQDAVQEQKETQGQGENKLGTAPLGRLMVSLAVPTILAQVVNLLYNMVDRMYVGRIPGAGSMALAGLGVSFPVILLISAFAGLVGMGGAPQASICLGKKDQEGAEKILGGSIAFLAVLAVLLSIFFYIVKEPLLMMFGASENTIYYANRYLGIYLLGTISVQFSLGLNQFITCQGFSKTGMMTVVIGAVINIILDPILIFGCRMGVQGAALATIISQTVSAVWVLRFLCGRKSILKVRRQYLRLDGAVLKPVLLLGISPFIMQSTECLVQLTFNSGMQQYGNDYYVSAMTILFSVMQFLFLPMQGLAQGATPIISYNYGAGNNERVQKAFRMLLVSALAFSLCATGAVLLMPRMFVSIFTTDSETMEIGIYGMRIYMAGFLFFGIQCACQQTFVALGQAKISMFLAMLRKIVLLIPLALILPRLGMGTDGLFWAEPISDVLAIMTTGTIFALNFRKILQKGA